MNLQAMLILIDKAMLIEIDAT